MSMKQSIKAQALIEAGIRIKVGLYLHEDSGQLFEVIESVEDVTEILYPCFLSGSLIHADFETTHLMYLTLEHQINYIGEV